MGELENGVVEHWAIGALLLAVAVSIAILRGGRPMRGKSVVPGVIILAVGLYGVLPYATNGHVRGVVTDADGRPVVAAVILSDTRTQDEQVVRTDPSGRFRLAIRDRAPEAHSLLLCAADRLPLHVRKLPRNALGSLHFTLLERSTSPTAASHTNGKRCAAHAT